MGFGFRVCFVLSCGPDGRIVCPGPSDLLHLCRPGLLGIGLCGELVRAGFELIGVGVVVGAGCR